jgi:hypothetical protein
LGIALFTLAFVLLAPPLWNQCEEFTLEPDDRIPHELSQDYWLFERYAALAAQECDTLVIGDSVVWGEYVTRAETLSHYLNRKSRPKNRADQHDRYANLGIGAAHPLALSELIEHYAGSIANKDVVLHCNPLWLSSLKTDLQDEKFTDFNHPRLVPQFFPRIPSYHKEEVSHRLGVLVEQRFAFNKWTNHLQQAYYDRSDIPGWTLEHPYDNPVEPLLRGLPPADNARRYLPEPWYKRGLTKTDFAWVDMETSLQWPAFQRAVETLQRRGNRVFVLVGPLNEHMMTPASLERYQKVKGTIKAWLVNKQIAHLVPEALPSEQYADASHPLAAGYEALARQVMAGHK